MARENRCVCCGAIIPEGLMVCRDCDNDIHNYDDYHKDRHYNRHRKVRKFKERRSK